MPTATVAAPKIQARRPGWVRLAFEGGLEVPELAFKVTRSVFTYAVRLVDRLLDDVRAGLNGAGVMGVGVIDGNHGHAGDRSHRTWRLVTLRRWVQPDDLVARTDLGMHDAPIGVAGDRARIQAVHAHQHSCAAARSS